jgi:long-chain acyl-CoA synthetase
MPKILGVIAVNLQFFCRVDTVTKGFNYAVKKFGNRECLGTRQILGVEDETQKNGKVFQKWALGDYQWMTYVQVNSHCKRFS